MSTKLGSDSDAADLRLTLVLLWRRVSLWQPGAVAGLRPLAPTSLVSLLCTHRMSASHILQFVVAMLTMFAFAETQYAIPNEFGQTYEAAGGVNLNASTGYDATDYHVSLPANKAELWFAMEAERFQRPVFRQLHSERKVILEERKQRIDSSYVGRFFEQFQARFVKLAKLVSPTC